MAATKTAQNPERGMRVTPAVPMPSRAGPTKGGSASACSRVHRASRPIKTSEPPQVINQNAASRSGSPSTASITPSRTISRSTARCSESPMPVCRIPMIVSTAPAVGRGNRVTDGPFSPTPTSGETSAAGRPSSAVPRPARTCTSCDPPAALWPVGLALPSSSCPLVVGARGTGSSSRSSSSLLCGHEPFGCPRPREPTHGPATDQDADPTYTNDEDRRDLKRRHPRARVQGEHVVRPLDQEMIGEIEYKGSCHRGQEQPRPRQTQPSPEKDGGDDRGDEHNANHVHQLPGL